MCISQVPAPPIHGENTITYVYIGVQPEVNNHPMYRGTSCKRGNFATGLENEGECEPIGEPPEAEHGAKEKKGILEETEAEAKFDEGVP